MPELILTPAYGRDYNSKDAVLADWNAGKDFKIHNGPYCSKRDITDEVVKFRYCKLRRVFYLW